VAPTYVDKLRDLALSAAACDRWLNATDVRGYPENELAARCALALFLRVADMTLLDKRRGAVLSPIALVTRRLRGLVGAPLRGAA
jgi:hypothetical protein